MIRQALHAAVAAAVVLLVLRTFIALGVVVPLQVDGASMAPGLLGRHIEYNCPRCVQRLQIDATQPPRPGSLTCPACEAQVRLDCGRPVHGDRIAVDRLMLAGPPGRWDRVVLRRPDDARRLAVKRVIGLPGERIVLHAGDLLVNGQVVQKGLADQRRTRILMHRESDNARRWRAESAGWRPTAGGGWSADCGPAAANGYPTLRYAPPGRSEPTDDLPYNAGVTRRLNAVTDVMLTAAVTASPDAELCLRVVSGRGAVYCRIDGPRRRVELTVNGAASATAPLPSAELRRPLRLTLSTFDQRSLVAIGDAALLALPLRTPPSGPAGAARRTDHTVGFEVVAHGGSIELQDLAVWRDVFYEPKPAGFAETSDAAGWRLGPREWFVVGDNQAVSLDSRVWSRRGGLPGRLILGRVSAGHGFAGQAAEPRSEVSPRPAIR